MNFLKNLFGNLNLDVNKLVDNVVTTDAERKELKIKFDLLFISSICLFNRLE